MDHGRILVLTVPGKENRDARRCEQNQKDEHDDSSDDVVGRHRFVLPCSVTPQPITILSNKKLLLLVYFKKFLPCVLAVWAILTRTSRFWYLFHIQTLL